jgi:hypothetical protein
VVYQVYLAWARENGITRSSGRNTFYDYLAHRYPKVPGHYNKDYFKDIDLSHHRKELLGKKKTSELSADD